MTRYASRLLGLPLQVHLQQQNTLLSSSQYSISSQQNGIEVLSC